MNLKDLSLPTEGLSAKVEFEQSGIIFHLRYISKAKVQQITRASTTLKYDDAIKARREVVDPKKLLRNFLQQAVSGWSGATPETLSRLVSLDLSKMTPEQLLQEVPYSLDNVMHICEEAYDIDTFLQREATELMNFKPDHEAELKNSEASQSGS